MSPRLGSPVRRLCLLTGLAIVALLLVAQVAGAATATTSAGTLTFTATAGETNAVEVTQTGAGVVTVADGGISSIDIAGASGCTTPDNTIPYVIQCTGITAIHGDLADGDDNWDGRQVTDLPQTVSGGEGSDWILGGGAGDTLDGGGGDDLLDGEAGADTVTGGSGSDELDDEDTAGDNLNGGNDDDYIYTGTLANGVDTYAGGAGTDQLDYSQRSLGVTVDLNTGLGGETGSATDVDTLSGIEDVFGSYTAGNVLSGDGNANDLEGGGGQDAISGGGGADTLYGGDANDNLVGGDGNDVLSGGAGADVLNGGNDDDVIFAGDGGDNISGGAGNDEIDPGSHFNGPTVSSDGPDTVDGGDGTDSIAYYDRTASVTLDLRGTTGSPTTTNGESGENDSLANIENVAGGGGNDTITGTSGANVIDDGGGADTVHALAGDDWIFTQDGTVDSADCGDGADTIEADVAGQFGSVISDLLTGCETVNPDYVAPTPAPSPTTTTTTTTTGPTNTTPTTVTQTPINTAPAPFVITPGAFLSRIQQSPKANLVFGSANIPADGTSLEVDLFYNGKLAKLNLVGKLVKKSLKKGVAPFQVKLNKKAAKLARKKGKRGLPITVKVTIKPPSGKATIKTVKVIVKKGKTPTCAARSAEVHGYIAC